jgi:hypothetical protein
MPKDALIISPWRCPACNNFSICLCDQGLQVHVGTLGPKKPFAEICKVRRHNPDVPLQSSISGKFIDQWSISIWLCDQGIQVQEATLGPKKPFAEVCKVRKHIRMRVPQPIDLRVKASRSPSSIISRHMCFFFAVPRGAVP